MLARISCAGRVKNSDIEEPGRRRRITQREILVGVPTGEAAAMHRDADILERLRLRVILWKHIHVVRVDELLGKGVSGVVISEHDERVDPRPGKSLHAADEVDTSWVVPLRTIKKVSSEHDESASLLDRQADQIIERLPRRLLNPLCELRRLPG
jgi:hypothetical protein